MQNKRNYYRILHVQPDAPIELIRMSYRTIMQKLRKHPDLGGDEWDASVINEAYSVLSDAKTRAAYDARLLRERSMADAGTQSEAQRASAGKDDKAQASATADSSSQDRAQTEAEPEPKVEPQPEAQARTQQQAKPKGPHCAFCKTPYSGMAAEDSDCVSCASPLSALDAAHYETVGRRLVQRQVKHGAMHYYAYWPGPSESAVMVDLSPQGMKFRSFVGLHPGHVIKVECALFKAVAEISHSAATDDAYLLGAKFLSIRFVASQGNFVQTSA